MNLEIIICYMVIYIIEALILWQYCSNIFISKYRATTECAFAILIYIIPFFAVFLNNTWLNCLLFLLANFIYILACYKTQLHTSLFHATITTVIMALSELLFAGIFSNLVFDFYVTNYELHHFVILTVLSKLSYFFVLELITYFGRHSKTTVQIYSFDISMLTIVPLVSVVIVLSFTAISTELVLASSHSKMIAVSMFLLLIINILTFGIYNYNQKKSQEFTELQIQYQHEYDSAEYYKMLTQQHEDQSILIHDIKKHLNSIASLNELGCQEEIAIYINRIIDSDLRPSVRVCDNEMLNAILGRYLHLCQDKKIDFRLDIRSNSISFLNEDDLTSLFCNLLDNALESAEKQDDSFIELNVSKKEKTPFTVLTMTNTCRSDPFLLGNGSLVTHKKDKLRHGYGVKSIKRIVSKYNGDIEMYYDKGTTTFHTILTLKNLPQ